MCAIKLTEDERNQRNNLINFVNYLIEVDEINERINERMNERIENHFDLESYLSEVRESKKDLEERRSIRKSKAEKRFWVRRTLQISALLILAIILGFFSYGHLVFVSQILSSVLWIFTLSYSFWEKREKFYRVIHMPEKLRCTLQIIGLAYRILFLPILFIYVLLCI